MNARVYNTLVQKATRRFRLLLADAERALGGLATLSPGDDPTEKEGLLLYDLNRWARARNPFFSFAQLSGLDSRTVSSEFPVFLFWIVAQRIQAVTQPTTPERE